MVPEKLVGEGPRARMRGDRRQKALISGYG